MSTRSTIFVLLLVATLAVGGLWVFSENGPFEQDQGDIISGFEMEPPPTPPQTETEPTPEHAEQGTDEGAMQAPAANMGQELNEQNRLAIALLKEERYAEAEELFRKCWTARPEESAFAANLAEALVRRAIAEFDAQPEPSLAALLEAIQLGRSDLEPLRARWAKIIEAQAGYAEDQSQHFVLQYDGTRDELLSTGYLQVLEDLEAAYQDYGEFFDIFPVDAGREKFSVVLYDRDVFDSVTGIGEWAGGAFDGTIRVPVRNFSRDHLRIRDVLRHELVHAFIQEIGGKKVPGWLNEGLAQYLSPVNVGLRNVAVQSALKRMKGKETLAFGTLEGTLAGLPDADTIRMAYDQGLGLTHWIAFHYGERTLVPMVTGCKQGHKPSASFQQQIHLALSDATRDFLDSL